MRSVGLHSTSGSEKEGIKERTGWLLYVSPDITHIISNLDSTTSPFPREFSFLSNIVNSLNFPLTF